MRLPTSNAHAEARKRGGEPASARRAWRRHGGRCGPGRRRPAPPRERRPAALSTLNDTLWSELSPWLSADRSELWFASSRPGGPGLFDIWRATRSSQGGGLDNPQPVDASSSPEDDSGVSLTSDGLTAVLSSSRSGTLGGRDLWGAVRATRMDDFTVDANLGQLNSAQDDTDPA